MAVPRANTHHAEAEGLCSTRCLVVETLAYDVSVSKVYACGATRFQIYFLALYLVDLCLGIPSSYPREFMDGFTSATHTYCRLLDVGTQYLGAHCCAGRLNVQHRGR